MADLQITNNDCELTVFDHVSANIILSKDYRVKSCICPISSL